MIQQNKKCEICIIRKHWVKSNYPTLYRNLTNVIIVYAPQYDSLKISSLAFLKLRFPLCSLWIILPLQGVSEWNKIKVLQSGSKGKWATDWTLTVCLSFFLPSLSGSDWSQFNAAGLLGNVGQGEVRGLVTFFCLVRGTLVGGRGGDGRKRGFKGHKMM